MLSKPFSCVPSMEERSLRSVVRISSDPPLVWQIASAPYSPNIRETLEIARDKERFFKVFFFFALRNRIFLSSDAPPVRHPSEKGF